MRDGISLEGRQNHVPVDYLRSLWIAQYAKGLPCIYPLHKNQCMRNLELMILNPLE